MVAVVLISERDVGVVVVSGAQRAYGGPGATAHEEAGHSANTGSMSLIQPRVLIRLASGPHSVTQ